ncbi:hypothetical protein KY346_01340 [Candidatus Woesearchaeota archaeon]|nr:hypothetical protein [Candidatus Woesearchaeota archaeon]
MGFIYNLRILSQTDDKEDSREDTLENMVFANPIHTGDILKIFLDTSFKSCEIPLELGKVVLINQFAANKSDAPKTYANVTRTLKDDRFDKYVEEYTANQKKFLRVKHNI